MFCFRDKTFCGYFKTCREGEFCKRALTEDILYFAQKAEMPVSQFIDKPDCYRKRPLKPTKK